MQKFIGSGERGYLSGMKPPKAGGFIDGVIGADIDPQAP